ncbi:MAG: tRNA (adenosine(37)-N6)-dimethylallyltransferase MiaA [Verrucomicrobia bacterium]|nr:tRNA (adenosine(37)-N6)-dimethylallyltransferase MiaA [Verrucomicrobiota bacterium]
MSRPPALYVLTGPTASGKTEWALRWAEENNAEIVSCDSLLFYRGMDIGTAKPTRDELARVPHHLIDVCEVTARMDITDYVSLAKQAVQEIAARGKRVLVTGGSGFYLKAFFGPVADEVTVSAELREEIDAKLQAGGLTALIADLEKLNPAGLGALDVANPRRVVRALERCRASGKTLAEMAADFAKMPGPFSNWAVQLVRLEREPVELERRVVARVDAMLSAGLIGEVERLLTVGLKTNPSASLAIGYRETVDFLEGRLARTDLADAIVRNTRGLVKKQRTWFRTQLPEHKVVAAASGYSAGLFAV